MRKGLSAGVSGGEDQFTREYYGGGTLSTAERWARLSDIGPETAAACSCTLPVERDGLLDLIYIGRPNVHHSYDLFVEQLR